MRLVTALLLRNEAAPDRYLERVLKRAREFSDSIVVLNDRSTDATADICHEYDCIVKTRETLDAQAWGSEASARKELWELAMTQIGGPNDWVLINDGDQELIGDVRALCLSRETNAWSFVLFDLWSELEYREDQHWQAHRHPRPWLFAPLRVPVGWRADWSTARQIHTGHFPPNFPLVPGIAPADSYHWKHWAYSTPKAREAKHAQYVSTYHLMSPHERAHAESIIQ